MKRIVTVSLLFALFALTTLNFNTAHAQNKTGVKGVLVLQTSTMDKVVPIREPVFV